MTNSVLSLASRATQELQRREAIRELSRRNLLDFACLLYPGFQVAPHHRAVADALSAVERGEISRLIIALPPRHGKSLLTSILFPAWYLGRHPDRRLMACSYSAELSYAFSRQARNMLASDDYRALFPGVAIAPDARAVAQWELAGRRGGYVSAGVGGSITGKGANLLLIDDPVKDAEEAGSDAVLENIWDWYSTTAYSRLEQPGAVVLIMTRWAEADLTGRLLHAQQDDPAADRWHVVRLPALAEEGDLLGREPGQALWPEKYDAAALDQIKRTMGSRAFSALYQQNPVPLEGGLWKKAWWRYYDRSAPLPRCSRVCQFWDTAYKKGQHNDYTACVTMGLCAAEKTLYLLDVYQARVEFPGLTAAITQHYAKWKAVPGCKPTEICIEDKASGTSAYQSLRVNTELPVIAIPVETDKISRANAATPFYEAERVRHPAGAPWLSGYEEQLERFPSALHDDMVDATSGCVARLMGTADGMLDYLRRQVAKGSPHV